MDTSRSQVASSPTRRGKGSVYTRQGCPRADQGRRTVKARSEAGARCPSQTGQLNMTAAKQVVARCLSVEFCPSYLLLGLHRRKSYATATGQTSECRNHNHVPRSFLPLSLL